MTETESTREKIMDAALDLFTQTGFDRTTIGDIEEAAGLSPRSGAFYRHFDSKRDLLEVVLDRQIEDIEEMRNTLDMMPLGDFEAEVRFFVKWGLQLIKQGHRIYLTLIPLKQEFPELMQRFYDRVIEKSYDLAQEWAQRKQEDDRIEADNLDRVMVTVVNSMVQHQQISLLFGDPPAGIEDDEYIETITRMILSSTSETS
ncbi:MAG: TetR/AcrR family transcriptional regulator [bacterium]